MAGGVAEEMNQSTLLATTAAMGLAYLLLKWKKKDTIEDVVHQTLVGAIEEAVAQASSRWREAELKKLIYVAHPLTPLPEEVAEHAAQKRMILQDAYVTLRRMNLERAARWVAWIAEFGHVPVATWITLASVWDESKRDAGLANDFELLARCDEMWLVGGRISRGMDEERKAASDAQVPWHDFTNLGVEPPTEVQFAQISDEGRWNVLSSVSGLEVATERHVAYGNSVVVQGRRLSSLKARALAALIGVAADEVER